MNIFESLENLPVSEACFNDIMDMVEGVMDDIKAGMSPEKAKEKWVKDKNNEYVKAVEDSKKAKRLADKAEKKYHDYRLHGKEKTVDYNTYKSLSKRAEEADKIKNTKFNNQLKANFETETGKHKMVLPTFSGGEYAHQTGYDKGGKKYTPKSN